MSLRYEIIAIDSAEFSVDVSRLKKTDDIYFNATEIAKRFGKRPKDFLALESTKEYIEAVRALTDSEAAEMAVFDAMVKPVDFDFSRAEHLVADPVLALDRIKAAGLRLRP